MSQWCEHCIHNNLREKQAMVHKNQKTYKCFHTSTSAHQEYLSSLLTPYKACAYIHSLHELHIIEQFTGSPYKSGMYIQHTTNNLRSLLMFHSI